MRGKFVCNGNLSHSTGQMAWMDQYCVILATQGAWMGQYCVILAAQGEVKCHLPSDSAPEVSSARDGYREANLVDRCVHG